MTTYRASKNISEAQSKFYIDNFVAKECKDCDESIIVVKEKLQHLNNLIKVYCHSESSLFMDSLTCIM